jgi:hypothetical protein
MHMAVRTASEAAKKAILDQLEHNPLTASELIQGLRSADLSDTELKLALSELLDEALLEMEPDRKLRKAS